MMILDSSTVAEPTAYTLPTPKIVEIDWIDSWGSHGWQDRKRRLLEIPDGAGRCKSIGYVLEEREDWVMITSNLDSDENVGCTMSIPRFAILGITTLREAVE